MDQRDAEGKPMGSGWRVISIDTLAIDIFETKPLRGSSYIETPDKYSKTKANTHINNSCKHGVLKLYDDSATQRGIILHPTPINCAVIGTCNPTRSSGIMALTLDQGVNIKSTLSVSKIATNRTEQTLIMQAENICVMTKFVTEIFGFDGTKNI